MLYPLEVCEISQLPCPENCDVTKLKYEVYGYVSNEVCHRRWMRSFTEDELSFQNAMFLTLPVLLLKIMPCERNTACWEDGVGEGGGADVLNVA